MSKATGKLSLVAKPKKKKPRTVRSLDEKYTGAEPEWDNHKEWSYAQFRAEKARAYYYYNYFHSVKDLIPNVIQWMGKNGYNKEDIRAYNEMPDWKTSITMGSIATMMLKGCPTKHPDAPAEETGTDAWLKRALEPVIQEGKLKLLERKKEECIKENAPAVNIQDRIKESAYRHMESLEDWLDEFLVDASKFDPKKINVNTYFKAQEINQAHARVIRDFYEPIRDELFELLNPPKVKNDLYAQLVEGYRHYTKPQLKNLLLAYDEILSACDMFLRQAKVNRKPRVKKAPSKEKLVSKVKFKASDERYKLVSIKPDECLQALEVWVFNSKTRKMGCYVAEEFQVLSIKGTSIINFNPKKSVAKTVRKPEELLKGVSGLSKTKIRKLFDGIKGVDTLLNGRINEDIVLLKAFNN